MADKIEKKEEDKIELRSEEFQDILGSVPHWILRRGITILAVVVVVLVAGSAMFKYPDVIGAEITLTGMTPPANIMAKASGKLEELLVADNQIVAENEWLAIIENPASTEDVVYLRLFIESLDIDKVASLPRKDLTLGNLQSLYSAFYNQLNDYIVFERTNYYPSKIAMAAERIEQNKKQFSNLVYQSKLIEKQFSLSRRQFERDSTIHAMEMSSPHEFEAAQSQYLQACMSLESNRASLDNMQMQIGQMEESLYDLEQQYEERKNAFTNQLLGHISQLKSEINAWEMNYVLSSPIAGKVSFTKYWVKNQNIAGGEEAFTVVPVEEPQLIGKASLPVARSGKVRVGQKVNIRFENFPDAEFGLIKGIVKNISLVPTQTQNAYSYTVEVLFPEGLRTTYGKDLPFLPQMKGQADIITDDITLLQRFIMPLRKIWQKGQ